MTGGINKIGDWIYKFLRRNQKYTGTDNVYLAKGGFWLTLGQIVSMAIAFLSAIVFANLLDPVTYGNYKYILSLLGIMAILSLDGIGAAITQAVARGLEGSFYTGFKIKLKWGLLGSLAAVAGAAYYWFKGNQLLSIPLLTAAVFLPLMYASQIFNSFLIGRKLFNVRTGYRIINQAISAGATIIALFFTKNLFILIAVYLFFNTFLDYFFYYLTKSKFRPNKKEDSKTISYAKHLSLMSVINYIAAYLDKILLFALAGPAQLAVYSFAILLPDQIKTMADNIETLAYPKFAERPRKEIKAGMMKKFWKLTFFALVVIVLYFVIAPYFFKIFFPQYLDSVRYSQVFMLTLISFPTLLMSTAFQAKIMKKELYLLRSVAFSRIVLYAALIPFFGIWGVILAKVGAEIFCLFLNLFLFRKF